MTEAAAVRHVDCIVIGAGIAGASVGYELAARLKVVLLEMESQPGFHSTGRSAALFSEIYGPPAIRALSRASRPFFEAPPAGFGEHELLSPRGVLFIGRADQAAGLAAAEASGAGGGSARVSPEEACRLVPILRRDYVAAAVLEPGARDVDVHALHSGYLRGLRGRGGSVVMDAEVQALTRIGGLWRAETAAGSFAAPILVNAAGAWGDEVARLAGVQPVGLVPKRRTAFVFEPPAGLDARLWPMVIDADEAFYFKPDAGRLIGSPGDETPVPPGDAAPEDLDVATAAWRIEQATTMEIRHILRRWAGLRSFVADKSPVAGFAADAEGFFFLVGQGGYGIQSAPALARYSAGLILGGDIPADLKAQGLSAADLSPVRFAG
jgi:D-arginine dehydrogenase